MAEFSLAHIGINAENEADALKIAELFAALFSFEVKPGNSSVFAGTAVEVMKTPYLGANGHIAIARRTLRRRRPSWRHAASRSVRRPQNTRQTAR